MAYPKMAFCPKGHAYDKNSFSACPFCSESAPPIPQPPQPPPLPTRVRPVVGWLICIQGYDVGEDFRLRTGYNSVGLAEDQDVRLSDRNVSREHFTVAYEPEKNLYSVHMGKGKTIVRINDKVLEAAVELRKGDQIKVGDTVLIFIPLEQQYVKWNWEI